ncbi:chromate transporter [Cohnella zeiphila]|uniref:Chromate transporter n=1 Tax=Cohnella zeiphila TaxID=2761120 RepID=A0A7X0SJ53_9BACL|nr:chromate transporter [Cohnella zeiphila]MBB6730939.1 chromate transporter [Cohnella zeiphila]
METDGKRTDGNGTNRKEAERKIASPTFAGILWSFLKLAPISFGGGYAIFPALEKEMIANRGWMDDRELAESLSLAAAAPGGVGVNAAFLIGYRLKGIWGAVAAGIGAIVPTFAIVLGLFLIYQRTGDSPKVRAALGGVTWGIVTLILFAALRIGRSAIHDKFTAGLMLAALACLLAGLPPLYLIVGGALIGIAAAWTRDRKRDDHKPASPMTGRAVGGDTSYMYYI